MSLIIEANWRIFLWNINELLGLSNNRVRSCSKQLKPAQQSGKNIQLTGQRCAEPSCAVTPLRLPAVLLLLSPSNPPNLSAAPLVSANKTCPPFINIRAMQDIGPPLRPCLYQCSMLRKQSTIIVNIQCISLFKWTQLNLL